MNKSNENDLATLRKKWKTRKLHYIISVLLCLIFAIIILCFGQDFTTKAHGISFLFLVIIWCPLMFVRDIKKFKKSLRKLQRRLDSNSSFSQLCTLDGLNYKINSINADLRDLKYEFIFEVLLISIPIIASIVNVVLLNYILEYFKINTIYFKLISVILFILVFGGILYTFISGKKSYNQEKRELLNEKKELESQLELMRKQECS